MRVLSIDPGFTTGVAIYEDEEFRGGMVVTRSGLYENGLLSNLVAIAKPNAVLIEDIPQNLVSSEMRELHAYVVNWFRVAGFDPQLIKPSQWKNLTERVKVPGDHIRDAATMGKWWIEREKVKNA